MTKGPQLLCSVARRGAAPRPHYPLLSGTVLPASDRMWQRHSLRQPHSWETRGSSESRYRPKDTWVTLPNPPRPSQQSSSLPTSLPFLLPQSGSDRRPSQPSLPSSVSAFLLRQHFHIQSKLGIFSEDPVKCNTHTVAYN